MKKLEEIAKEPESMAMEYEDYNLVGMKFGPLFPRLHNAGYYLYETALQIAAYFRNLVHYKK